jgi:chaperonin GroES
MPLDINNSDIQKFILIGDRVLLKPKNPQERTQSGLILPPGVQEKENIQTGYIIKVGPGYPIPAISETEEPWKSKSDNVKYVPLQAKEGDLALFLQNSAFEIEFNKESTLLFLILPYLCLYAMRVYSKRNMIFGNSNQSSIIS